MSKSRARKPRPRENSHHHGGRDAPPATLAPATPTTWPAVRYLPAILGVALALFGLVYGGARDPVLRWSLVGAGLVLVAWNAWLLAAPTSRHKGLIVPIELRKQHYLQACAQATVLIYWGLHLPFPLVRDHLPLIAAQLAFAYGFDMLLGWTRRARYSLGFGPFPVIFSMNLFLWFKPEWFFFQFLMVAVGFAAKELIRWNRDGRLVHIFNPSSFPLAVASIALILSGTTDLTYGAEIAASQNGPPHMYLLLFLVALPGQLLFGVASMTCAAVVTTYLFGLIYLQVTGTYFFLDCYLPVPVFLGMHLLFTDPSTSPRTELGRLGFGALYGLSTCLLYQIALSAAVPSFYDKLLQVPLMNLSVRAIDRLAGSRWLQRVSPERLGRSVAVRWRRAAYTSIWAVVFVTLNLTGGLGDHHRGQWWPFWIQACEQGRPRACAYLAVAAQQLCSHGSGWACNEAAILGPRSYAGLHAPMDRARMSAAFMAGCSHGFKPACNNHVHDLDEHPTFERAPPTLSDYQLLLRGSRRWSIGHLTPAETYALACEQGWPATCGRTGDNPSH